MTKSKSESKLNTIFCREIFSSHSLATAATGHALNSVIFYITSTLRVKKFLPSLVGNIVIGGNWHQIDEVLKN